LLAGTMVVVLTLVPTTLTELGLLPGFDKSVWGYVTSAPALLLPLSIVGAVTEPRWIDIDFVIRRSFVLGTLSLIILAIYVAGAAAIGLAVGAELPIELAFVLTVVVAVALQPVRGRLQRQADRWVFGARPSGYEALADFGSTVTDESRPSEVVGRLATSVRQALRLRWATVNVQGLGSRTVGEPSGEPTLELDLGRPGNPFGRLRCGEPLGGPLGPDEVALARALAAQATAAISNARLAARIVEAQEEERHRIERNLHDGAQQELVALVARLSLVRSRMETGVLDVASIEELQLAVRRILNDIRELAQGISPSVVRDGGIVAAVEERCARLPIDVTLKVEPALRRARFPAQIEGAAYFLVAESLANVLKHAHATRAQVSLQRQGAGLAVSIADNGNGFDESANRGSGLSGLEDRITALGGTMQITSRPADGTLVTAMIPVAT
jgi:signal transduction histidine kinase